MDTYHSAEDNQTHHVGELRFDIQLLLFVLAFHECEPIKIANKSGCLILATYLGDPA